MSKIGNPKGVENILLSSTGKNCFTFNKEDDCFAQWSVDTSVVEEVTDNNDDQDEQLLNDIKDIFCYVQIEKGAKALSRTVPLEEIATICRALGFYPTDKEIDDMMNEVKTRKKCPNNWMSKN